MTPEKIISDIKKGGGKSIYWLEGEENYFIDQIVDFAEHNILSESEASFNLTIFYGRDTAWADVINACRRYPMFAEKQVVIVKEAQDVKNLISKGDKAWCINCGAFRPVKPAANDADSDEVLCAPLFLDCRDGKAPQDFRPGRSTGAASPSKREERIGCPARRG